MASVVGTKGQIVIDRVIRRRLGIQPGWRAVQQVVGERVQIEFVPAPHGRSLRGVLAQYAAGGPVLDDVDRELAAGLDAAADWRAKEQQLGPLRTITVMSHENE